MNLGRQWHLTSRKRAEALVAEVAAWRTVHDQPPSPSKQRIARNAPSAPPANRPGNGKARSSEERSP